MYRDAGDFGDAFLYTFSLISCNESEALLDIERFNKFDWGLTGIKLSTSGK